MALSLNRLEAFSEPSRNLGALATQALLNEANLTPKPGLVDRRGAGSHADMSLALMERSAWTLQPYFANMATISAASAVNVTLRQRLGAIGRDAERAMFRATAGINTHKGAIWVLGLLTSAAAQVSEGNVSIVASRAGELARIPDTARPLPLSHGDLVRLRFSKTGARGEAMAGFPHAVAIGLPELYRSRATGCTETESRLNALLAIMASLDDTCLLYRGGAASLALVQAQVKCGAH